MTQTTSHALEDKYNAEDDAKKINSKQKEEKTNLDKLPTLRVGVF